MLTDAMSERASGWCWQNISQGGRPQRSKQEQAQQCYFDMDGGSSPL
jgi:hypothetical protein